jgi:hypothetical protein
MVVLGEGGGGVFYERGTPVLLVAFRVDRERVLYLQPTGPNPHNLRDGFSRPALRHGSLISLFQVAACLPS